MKRAYPIIIEPVQDVHPYVVSIPDLDIFTEGDSLYDAVDMARDAIGLFLVDRLDNVPDPSDIADVQAQAPDGAIVTLVDIDLLAYKRQHDRRSVKKTLTIPAWLNERAEAEGINFSAVLREALEKKTGAGQAPVFDSFRFLPRRLRHVHELHLPARNNQADLAVTRPRPPDLLHRAQNPPYRLLVRHLYLR